MLRILCAAVMAFALSSPALARHRAQHHHFNARVQMVSCPTFSICGTARNSSLYPDAVPHSDLVSSARAYIGVGAIFGRSNLWCARFMNYVLRRAGLRGTGSDLAKSFLKFPHTSPHIGAIAVLGRRHGGHVGIVTGFDREGNPIIVSGNHGHRVAEARYPKSRVLAYVTAG
jgi:uncharacterized protein (TIGR02594 family)